MKRCPQCNSVFDDSLDYCTNDGTLLTQETFVLPSEVSPLDAEEETVVRQEPITIDIHHPHQTAATEQFNFQPPPAETVIPVVIERRRNTGKYLLFLVVGLVLGGGLVLAAVLFSVYLTQNQTTQVSNTVERNSQSNSTTNLTPKPTPTETPVTAGPKHEKRTDAPDEDFNGRVISQNAYVRSSPSRTSKEIDVLPINDRLEIEEREDENSPWFRVTCEHGTSGWMHGNTIEFTK